MTEILAPAGGREQLVAAVRAGADAVYLGTKSFSARASAHNFDEEELNEAVCYCHARNVRVHVALNTLITDIELPAMETEIKAVANSGADAVIVQDLAVARMIREMCPSLELHASTQMTIYNSDGAKKARELGFSRAVLARELELSEIACIAGSSGIETEVFVHGALCMSVSGACCLSSIIGGRSGNRGRCAQPCRLDFRCNERSFALSLKDMSYIPRIKELAEAGVSSFKIEGRMKRPEYVACAVKAARDALDGKVPDMETLKELFSRGGFTDAYLTGKRNASMFGIRTAEDVKAGAAAMGRAKDIYRRERQSVPVDMHLSVKPGSTTLELSDGVYTAQREGRISERARSLPIDAEQARKTLCKLGETPFFLASLSCDISENWTVKSSDLGELRRSCAGELLKKREESVQKPCLHFSYTERQERCQVAHPEIRLRAENAAQVRGVLCDKLILPLKEIAAKKELLSVYGESLIGELPAVIFEKDVPYVKKLLAELSEAGLTAVLAENIGAVCMAMEQGLKVHGGFGLNVFNSLALDEYERLGIEDITLSFELNAKNIAVLYGKLRRGIMAYGYLPLMRLRFCPARSKSGCPAGCSGKATLTDRKGEQFPLSCNDRKYSTLYNCVPLYVGDRSLHNIDFKTLYFTKETNEEVKTIVESLRSGSELGQRRTGGLYFRDLE